MASPIAPVKVAFLIGSLEVGGAETQLVRLANSLDRARFSPTIVCLWRGGELEGAVAPDVHVLKAILPSQRSPGPGGRVILAGRTLTSLVGALRSLRPDIVHAYLPAAYVLGGLVAWGLRVPIIIASRRGLTSYETLGAGMWLGKLANRVIDLQVCNSYAVRDWAIKRERLPLDRTRVVHNGIDLPPLEPRHGLPAEWTSDEAQAVMIANFIHYKGHRDVARAVALVARRHPSFRLILIGDGPERPALTELVRELGIAGNVIFAGRRLDAAELSGLFDFAVLGSSEEGFPNALMESMARAVPVVSTAVGGVNELVTDAVHGRLVPSGDPKAMAEAMTWMIEHPAERKVMGANARGRIAEEFSTERMVKSTESVYEELLNR